MKKKAMGTLEVTIAAVVLLFLAILLIMIIAKFTGQASETGSEVSGEGKKCVSQVSQFTIANGVTVTGQIAYDGICSSDCSYSSLKYEDVGVGQACCIPKFSGATC